VQWHEIKEVKLIQSTKFAENCYCFSVLTIDKNSSGDEIANVNFYAVHLEGT